MKASLVRTLTLDTAANFGSAQHSGHDERYDRAAEFVRRLRESWPPEAFVGDQLAGRYVDTTRREHPAATFRSDPGLD